MAFDPDGDEQIDARTRAERPIGMLLSDLASEAALLIRQELALFKAEMSEKFGRAGQGTAMLAAGGLIVFSGWLVLLAAAVLALSLVLPGWASALIIGAAVLVVGVILLLVGKNRIAAKSLTPDRTLRSLREDQAWLTERLR